jgi:predicted metal-binding membrane protein
MTSMDLGPTLPASVPMMAAMMLPSAIPAIARRARERDGVLAAPLFAGSYLGTWALVALAMCLLYRPPGAVSAGALMVGAGLYELSRSSARAGAAAASASTRACGSASTASARASD